MNLVGVSDPAAIVQVARGSAARPVLPQPDVGGMVCEHHTNDGRLAHTIEGRKAALIAAAVERAGSGVSTTRRTWAVS